MTTEIKVGEGTMLEDVVLAQASGGDTGQDMLDEAAAPEGRTEREYVVLLLGDGTADEHGNLGHYEELGSVWSYSKPSALREAEGEFAVLRPEDGHVRLRIVPASAWGALIEGERPSSPPTPPMRWSGL